MDIHLSLEYTDWPCTPLPITDSVKLHPSNACVVPYYKAGYRQNDLEEIYEEMLFGVLISIILGLDLFGDETLKTTFTPLHLSREP